MSSDNTSHPEEDIKMDIETPNSRNHVKEFDQNLNKIQYQNIYKLISIVKIF